MEHSGSSRRSPSREACEKTIKRILMTEVLENGRNKHFKSAADFMNYFESLYPASDALTKQVQRAVKALDIGAATIELHGATFGIYDKERMICDCLKYESKMEHDDFKAAIQGYIKDEDKDISNLLEYARERKVIKKVQSFIGVWL